MSFTIIPNPLFIDFVSDKSRSFGKEVYAFDGFCHYVDESPPLTKGDDAWIFFLIGSCEKERQYVYHGFEVLPKESKAKTLKTIAKIDGIRSLIQEVKKDPERARAISNDLLKAGRLGSVSIEQAAQCLCFAAGVPLASLPVKAGAGV